MNSQQEIVLKRDTDAIQIPSGNPLQLPGQVEVELVELHGLAERLLPRLGGGFEGLDGLPQLFAVADDVVPVKMTVGYRTTNYSKSVPYQGNRFMQ